VSQRWHDTKIVYKVNWKEAWCVLLTFAVQFTFYPGVMLEQKWTFIPSFSWFVITLVTYASWADTVGRFIAGKIDLIPKRHFGLWCLIRGALFTMLYLLAFFGVWEKILGSSAF